jgi:hypothetical protein
MSVARDKAAGHCPAEIMASFQAPVIMTRSNSTCSRNPAKPSKAVLIRIMTNSLLGSLT